MADAYIVRRGGGSALNFKVIAVANAASLPANAKENTIAVITDAPISEWQMDSLPPSVRLDGNALQNGDVWIENLRVSDIALTTMRRRGVRVYPGAAKQYLSGTWVAKDARIFQNRQWTPLLFYLVQSGRWNIANTGGRLNVSSPGNSSYVEETGCFTITTCVSDGYSGIGISISTAKKVKTGMYDTLYLDSSVRDKDGYARYMCGLASTTAYSEYVLPSIRSGVDSFMPRAVRPIDITGVTSDMYVRFETSTVSTSRRMSQTVYNCWLT